MKVLLTVLVVLYAAAAASADDKAGHLFNAFKGKPKADAAPAPAPAPAHAAVVPPVAPSAAPAPAPAPMTVAGQAAPQVDPLPKAVDAAAAPEATEPVVVIEATDASPLPALLSFASSFFGANPTARDLRRPLVTAKSMEEDGAPAPTDADSLLPPRRGGGVLGAVCGGILDALFGPPPAPVVPAAPATDSSAVMTPGGWFNFRPSAFFESFMGPPAPMPMAMAMPLPPMAVDGADAPDANPTVVALGTPLVTVVSSVSTTDADGNTESEVTVLPPPPPSLLVPDAGMHRVGGRARVGKLFNRVMRFLNLRPRPDMAAPNGAESDGPIASPDDDVPPPTEDDDDSEEDEQPPQETDEQDDEAEAEEGGHAGHWHKRHGHGRGHRWLRWLKRKARKAARKAAKWFGRHGWRHGRGHGWRHGRWGRHHRACKEDVARLCPNAKDEGGFTAVVQCMAQHKDELSGQCLSHVQYSRAFNCADDAARLCPDARSRHALKRCLKRQRDQVSEQCKAAVRAHRKWWKRAAATEDDDDSDAAATATATDDNTDAVVNDNSAVEYVDADVVTADDASVEELVKQQQQLEEEWSAQDRLVIGLTQTDADTNAAPATALQAAPMHAVRRGPALMETKEQTDSAADAADAGGAKAQAKPSVAARVRTWVSGAAATASAHAKRLPQWAVVVLAVVAALAVVGAVSACVVVACRRRAARLAAAEPKQPLLSAAPGGAAQPHVQITALPARSARARAPEVATPAPQPLTAAAAVAAVAEPVHAPAPAVTVTVAAV